MQKVKYLIIGAGISGLSFACQKLNDDYLILEKEDIAGGLCKSFYDSEYVWDVSGHFFHFKSDEARNFFEAVTIGKNVANIKKCAKVYYKGKYMDAPFQYNIDQLPTAEFVKCLTDLYYTNSSYDKDNFEDYVIAKYGDGIAKKFLIPYNEKLYACRLNELECDSMGEYLPKLDFEMLMSQLKGESKSTYNDVFLYPVNGCMDFIKGMLAKLQMERIHLGEEVKRIDLNKKVVYTDVCEYEYEYLINTSPLSEFSQKAGYVEKKNLFGNNKVLVLNLGFDKDSIDKNITWAYYPGDEVFYRVGFYNNIVRKDKLSIYVEIGYGADECINVDNVLQKVLSDLKTVNILDDHKLLAYNSYVINPGYAYLTKECKNYVNILLEEMKNANVHMIGRYARWEYSAMDSSIEQAIGLSKEI